MKKEHTISINKREIPATYKMFLCHNTMKFNGACSQDEYSMFLRDYILPVDELDLYINTIAYQLLNCPINKRTKEFVYTCNLGSELRHSLLLNGWYAQFFYNHNPTIKGKISINELIDSGINYSRLSLSDEYLSLYPLTKFYKKLTINLDYDRYYSPIYDKDYVTVEDIKQALKNSDVSYEDIKEDLEHHSILTPYKNYYIWGSKVIYNWLLEVDHSIMFRINLNKILSVEHTGLF